MSSELRKKLLWLLILTVAFAYVEAAIVVYLRHIYYPEGFRFPIKRHYDYILTIEFIREFATLIILVSAGVLLSKKFWEGFAYFLMMFGTWDIFFYLWLKLTVNWPASIFDWDILFLIPMPWLGPVIAPVSLSLIMIAVGYLMLKLFGKGYDVRPVFLHWSLVLIGCAFILFSFMNDFDAAFFEKYPKPYRYEFLIIGEIFLALSFFLLNRKTITERHKGTEAQR
jgi:hypothetical protein